MTRRYRFHGIGVAVTADDEELLEAVHGRLRLFEDGDAPGELAVTYSFRAGGHVLERPSGRSRPVYDAPAGEAAYFPDGDALWLTHETDVRVLCRPSEGRSDVSVLASARSSRWLLSRPLLTLPLLELLERRGLHSLHAAGLAVDGRALLVTGSTGAGKSTLALALVRAGFGFMGDDMVFVEQRDAGAEPTVLGFPDEVDVTAGTARFFPELADLEPLPGWPKSQLRADEWYGADVVLEARPGALVLCRVADSGTSELRALSADEALLELAPNVLLTDPVSSQAHLDALGALVAASDCFRLETGRDLDAVPGLLRSLL